MKPSTPFNALQRALILLILFLSFNSLQSQTIMVDNYLGCDIEIRVYNTGIDPSCLSFACGQCCNNSICAVANTLSQTFSLCGSPSAVEVRPFDPCSSGSNCSGGAYNGISYSGGCGFTTTPYSISITCGPCGWPTLTVTWLSPTHLQVTP